MAQSSAQLTQTVIASIPVARSPNLLRRLVRHRSDYLYILPALGVMALLIVYPFIYTIYLSFFETPASSPEIFFIGLGNFAELMRNDIFWLVVQNTLVWSIGGTILPFILGTIAAILVNQKLPMLNLARGILIVPYVLGFVTASYAWRWMLHGDFGVISTTFQYWGWIKDPIPFLQSPSLIMPSLILVNTWKSFPFVMMMMLAGLQTIPEDLYKAARVDGASAWAQFWEITIPQLIPVSMVTSLLLFIANMNSFTLIEIMTGGGPAHLSEILITWIYHASFQTLRFGLASAASVLLFIVLIIFSVLYVRVLTGGAKVEGAG
jgi:multiple sugar transport system permease protein